MDLYIFNLINQFFLKWFWVDVLGIFFADYLGYILILGLFLVFLYYLFAGKNFFKGLVFSLLAALSARLAIIPIRFLWSRPRPFLFYKEPAFPSGHATFFFALSTVVFLYNKKLGLLFLTGSFLISIARVFIGLHWPSDILAGAFIGIFFGWFVHKCAAGGS